MQLTPRYLVTNRINVLANEAGHITEYRPVYQRQLQVYRGIDNKLQFRLLNADQRPISTNDKTPVFVAFDDSDTMLFESDCTTTDDGSSTTRGLFEFTITESALRSVKSQYLKYHIYLKDTTTNDREITYSNTGFGNDGVIFVSTEMYPGPKSSISVPAFYESSDVAGTYLTNAVVAEPGKNGNEALHTSVIYTDEFAGDVVIQGTLTNQLDGMAENWADIATVTFDGTETQPVPTNFTGVFNFIRFKTETVPTDKITKILVRN